MPLLHQNELLLDKLFETSRLEMFSNWLLEIWETLYSGIPAAVANISVVYFSELCFDDKF
jgi:hypothetical protein